MYNCLLILSYWVKLTIFMENTNYIVKNLKRLIPMEEIEKKKSK